MLGNIFLCATRHILNFKIETLKQNIKIFMQYAKVNNHYAKNIVHYQQSGKFEK